MNKTESRSRFHDNYYTVPSEKRPRNTNIFCNLKFRKRACLIISDLPSLNSYFTHRRRRRRRVTHGPQAHMRGADLQCHFTALAIGTAQCHPLYRIQGLLYRCTMTLFPSRGWYSFKAESTQAVGVHSLPMAVMQLVSSGNRTRDQRDDRPTRYH